jgi:dTDP-glucose pyrophosphorylase
MTSRAAIGAGPGQDPRGGVEEIVVHPRTTLRSTLEILDRTGRQIVLVCDEGGRLVGTITDGDVRRALLDGAGLDGSTAEDAMQRNFRTVSLGAGRAEILALMKARSISHLPALDQAGRLTGLHTMHEMLGSVDRPNAAVLMAGGKGTRLRPLTDTIPKPMVTVAGRPILERIVLHLVGYGLRRLYISINYLAHVVEEHFGDGSEFGCEITYLREEEPLGTAGCLSLIPDPITASLVVMNGDLVTQADIGRLLTFHETGGFAATLGLRPHTIDIPFGVATVDGDRVIELREKPTEQVLVNAGIYVLTPETLQRVTGSTHYLMTDLLRECIDDGLPVGAHLVEEEWVDVGRPDQLLRANGRI